MALESRERGGEAGVYHCEALHLRDELLPVHHSPSIQQTPRSYLPAGQIDDWDT